MGTTTGIAWTQKTWNPWQGCKKVSAGCRECYMFHEKRRYGQDPSTVIRSKPATFAAPLKWKEPALVFTCSWSDWFIEEADAWRDEAWQIIRETPNLTYQILTKRPERIREHLPADWGSGWANVWLGVSVEHQDAADRRLPELLAIPAVLRFLSCEPLLGPLNLRRWLWMICTTCNGQYLVGPDGEACNCARYGKRAGHQLRRDLSWVIVGGESGVESRAMALDWARDVMYQCRGAELPFFVKQLGTAWARSAGASDRKGSTPWEWPQDLRIQQMPRRADR